VLRPPLTAAFGVPAEVRGVKQVFLARDVPEAHFVRGLLESHGLDVAVRGEDLWGARGELPLVDTWPTVWVLDESCETEARRVIQEYESGKVERSEQRTGWRLARMRSRRPLNVRVSVVGGSP